MCLSIRLAADWGYDCFISWARCPPPLLTTLLTTSNIITALLLDIYWTDLQCRTQLDKMAAQWKQHWSDLNNRQISLQLFMKFWCQLGLYFLSSNMGHPVSAKRFHIVGNTIFKSFSTYFLCKSFFIQHNWTIHYLLSYLFIYYLLR